MSNIPEKLINFAVYLEGDERLGIADVTLPKLQAMTETVKGAGIAGEIDSPTLGHWQSMTLGINWRTLDRPGVSIGMQKIHQLDIRAANQVFETTAGRYSAQAVKLVVKAIPKMLDFGKLDVGATSGTATEHELTYMKLTIDGNDIMEIDKYNYICVINGEDYLAEVRSALGK